MKISSRKEDIVAKMGICQQSSVSSPDARSRLNEPLRLLGFGIVIADRLKNRDLAIRKLARHGTIFDPTREDFSPIGKLALDGRKLILRCPCHLKPAALSDLATRDQTGAVIRGYFLIAPVAMMSFLV